MTGVTIWENTKDFFNFLFLYIASFNLIYSIYPAKFS